MSTRIYRPDAIWVITFNGLSDDRDAEEVTICNTRRYAAISDFNGIVNALKEKYPYEEWFDDTVDSHNKKQLRLESVRNPRIFCYARRVCFVDGDCVSHIIPLEPNCQEAIRQWIMN